MCFDSKSGEVTPADASGLNLRELVTKKSKNLGPVTQRVARAVRESENAQAGRRRSVLVDPKTAGEKVMTAADIEMMFAWTYLKYPIGISHVLFFVLWAPVGALLVFLRLMLLAIFAAVMYWYVFRGSGGRERERTDRRREGAMDTRKERWSGSREGKQMKKRA